MTFVAMLKHIDKTGHKHCECGGYWYPHRPGSTHCEQNPYAVRHGATPEEVLDMLIDIALDRMEL